MVQNMNFARDIYVQISGDVLLLAWVAIKSILREGENG